MYFLDEFDVLLLCDLVLKNMLVSLNFWVIEHFGGQSRG